MVKSYQGVRVVEDKKYFNQPMCVKDYMATNLITFKPDDSIEHVLGMLTSKKISGGPVVDENGKLIGMISEGDCLKEIIKGKYSNTPSLIGTVKEHMTTDVLTMNPDLNIFDAAGQFLNMKIRRFPVMSHGNLIGQISISDIIKGVQKMKSTTW
ncbi:CBS domain-containing protein [Anditalea andensis]|uniref:Inosine-5-monophosphate dehydrogenase n=1 Tax=Anditalea andensis TaxID=1048983 RepID=A0A074KR14_9BACT|nr:CBS domain-containing protein [Anditalea andensis]KEO72396.1 inosine-5-monophosphate dehydrogenase [Anditalea andensis]